MIIPKVDEFFNVTAADLKIDSASANKDKAFIRVVSPLMPKVPQKEPITKIDNNTNSNNTSNSNSNSNNTSGSNTSGSNTSGSNTSARTEKKRGWLW